ncbi:MAG: TonB-dependent receptor [Phenylobacterium sp.]|jgi:iron complex outermembrane receptor protein|uniref:TonB-dependent receptor n=1 Tax=Phenylobacterium sp. TaxID=1871053 RepID=UPI0025E1FEBB|nr:TonB-dependent receptor [Phenylobacterium sp.]MCG9915186.1 TonB-dependent receptor [Phenylobacterium sp.]
MMSMTSHKRAAFACASAISLLAGEAAAQAERQEPAEVGEVVVTARRREERLIDVPVAASVVSAAALAERGGAISTGELLAGQPSVRFNNLTSSITSEVSMRASSTARATNGDPSVGLYRNGAYIGGGAIGGRNFSRLDMFDIGRVEVLRGTQGALYGRNAVGGAVNIVSARPEFSNGGYVDAKYGVETQRAQVQAAVNLAASDELAFRFGADYVHQDDGFFYNPVNDVHFDQEKGLGLRAQARLAKGPADVTLLVEHQQLTTPTITYQIAIPAGSAGFPRGYIQDQFAYPWNTPPLAKQNISAAMLSAQVDLGWAEFSSTSLVRVRESMYALDSDGVNPQELARARAAGQVAPATPIDPNGASVTADRTKTLSQDVRLSGQALEGRLDWLAGAEVMSQESRYSVTLGRTPTAAAPSVGTVEAAVQNYESWAAYGALTYDLTDDLSLTGELRYTSDDKTLTSRLRDRITNQLAGGAARIVDGTSSPENLSYNATLAYSLPLNLLAYGKVGTSYRAGGFNRNLGDLRQPVVVPVAYDDETSRSYELGVKGAPLSGVYVALAGYRTEMTDMIAQLDNGCRVTNPVCPVAATSFLTNAGDARSWGVEAEISGRYDLGDGQLRLSLNGSRQGGEVTSGRYAGLSLPQTPGWLASAEANYRVPVAGVEAFGNIAYNAQWGGVQELSAATPKLSDFQVVNARLGVDLGRIQVAAYVENLFDTVFIVAQDATVRRYSRPRLSGLQLRYSW